MRPRLLDLFCGAGGAAVGYHRAGFDVVGVDIKPQLHYPFEVHQGDAVEYFSLHAHEFDAIHASPPCQDHIAARGRWTSHQTGFMLAACRELFQERAIPWVIENVPGADMRADYRMCGCMFDLPRLRRERLFETSWAGFEMRPPCVHEGRAVTVAGHCGGVSSRDGSDSFGKKAEWAEAMGIDWMTSREMAQAIPPAYTEYVGRQLIEHLAAVAA